MSPEQERLWSRVESALDARRDPFDDAPLAAQLERDPELCAALRRLQRRLGAWSEVADEPPARESTRTPALPPLLAAAAAVLLVAFGTLAVVRSVSGSARPGTGSPLASVVHEARVVIESRAPATPRGARRALEPQRVVAWQLDESTRTPDPNGDPR